MNNFEQKVKMHQSVWFDSVHYQDILIGNKKHICFGVLRQSIKPNKNFIVTKGPRKQLPTTELRGKRPLLIK